MGDDARSVIASHNKIVTVWLAALLVTWLSGIEPMYQEISARTSTLSKVNAEKQRLLDAKLERLVSERNLHAQEVALEERMRQMREAPDRLKQLKSEIPYARKEKKERLKESLVQERDNLAKLLEKGSALQKIEADLDRRRKVIEAENQRFTSTWDEASTRYVRTAEEKQELERRQLKFELLGLQLEVPPLAAPVLWLFLATGLLMYIEGAATESSRVLTKEFLASSPPLPWWTYWFVEKDQGEGGVSSPSMNSMLVLAGLVVLTCRVSWTALDMTGFLGSHYNHALLIGAVLAGAGVLFVISASFVYRRAPVAADPRIRTILVSLPVAATATMYFIPKANGFAAEMGKASMLAIAILVGFAVLIELSLRWVLNRQAITDGGPSRRRVLSLAACAVVITAIAYRPRFGRREGRERRERGTNASDLTDGFYLNRIGRVYYYVRDGVIVSKKGLAPKRENLKVVSPVPSAAHSDRIGLFYSGAECRDWPTKLNNRPRMSLAASSNAFESAALALLEANSSSMTAYASACDVLLHGVKHDIYLKSVSGQTLSYRLMDLLAGLAVRGRQLHRLYDMLKLVELAGREKELYNMREKWENPLNRWTRRWASESPIKWAEVILQAPRV